MKIAVIQICSDYEPQTNLDKIDQLIKMAKANDFVDAVFLPEVFYSMSDGTRATDYLVEERNEHFQAISNIAKSHNVYLLGGSAATKVNDKIINRVYNFDPQGNLLSTYDKIHLFRVDLTSGNNATILDETKVYQSGSEPHLLDLGDWKLGISVCFDVRFPELFRKYYTQGANIMSVSAAFTVPTGRAHWETLLRARAIENQSYVIASAQWGTHNQRIKTYGHSMIIDPWGEIIANAGEGEGHIIAELDLDLIRKVRDRMNVAPQIKNLFG